MPFSTELNSHSTLKETVKKVSLETHSLLHHRQLTDALVTCTKYINNILNDYLKNKYE